MASPPSGFPAVHLHCTSADQPPSLAAGAKPGGGRIAASCLAPLKIQAAWQARRVSIPPAEAGPPAILTLANADSTKFAKVTQNAHAQGPDRLDDHRSIDRHGLRAAQKVIDRPRMAEAR